MPSFQSSQIGWIPYLNLHPMKMELQKLAGEGLRLQSGHPAAVNRWLADGAVQIAPCSSINLLQNSHLHMVSSIGIATTGPVFSVYLGMREKNAELLEFIRNRHVKLQQLTSQCLSASRADMRLVAGTLARHANDSEDLKDESVPSPQLLFTPASAASTALAKIFLNLWYGRDQAEMILMKSAHAGNQGSLMELVIGDEALVRRPEFSAVLDLGELWFEMTGLPFVFAVWQSVQSQVPEATRSLLLRAAELSSARMRIDYQTYLPDPLPRDVRGQPINLGAYWRAIQYQFTPAHLDGLLLYFNLYLELLKQTQKLHIAERVAKLEDQWRSGT